jgi:hypothetical protein
LADRQQKLNKNEARKLIAKILAKTPEKVVFTGHAQKRMEERRLVTADVMNILCSPSSKIISEAEFKDGSWSYRLETSFLLVVVGFTGDGSTIKVITVWDKR